MSKIGRFEDIKAWQQARVLTRSVYQATKGGLFAKDFALRDQIRRASLSIMLNIAEGFARRTDRDFARFLSQAHGSIAEVQSALYVAQDQSYIDKKSFDSLYESAEVCSKMTQSFMSYLFKDIGPQDSKTLRLPDSKVSLS
jgi:four helix bundle protein